MGLRKSFIKYFVPHKRNKYKPHFLRLEVSGAVGLAIVALFLGSIAEDHFLVLGGSSESAAVVASSLVDLANADRAQNDLPPLSASPVLQQAAQLKANDMAQNDYFAHTSPSGKDPWYWFQQTGYSFSYAGENLAVYFTDSTDVNTAWMNSPEHRANLLSPNYTQIGIATAQGMYQGYETTFVVEEFAAPAVASTGVAPEPVQPATPPQPVAAAKPATPQVAGASSEGPPVNAVISAEDAIAVKNADATPAPASTQNSVFATNPIQTFFLKFVTSPETDLTAAYEFIGAIVALALILEIGIEFKRQHPRRIVLGFSLIALMLVLLFADHVFLAGTVLIA